MHIPKRLTKGDKIGLIAPASGTTKDKVKKGVEAIEALGFEVEIGASCYEKYGYLAGSDNIRSNDINNMFSDTSIDGIFCIRGGYGTVRLLEKLDYEMIKENPKVFVGYSDITTLHINFNQRCKFVTYHGPMPTIDMIDSFDEFSKESLLNAVFNQGGGNSVIINPPQFNIETYKGGTAEGVLIGGNLSLISATIGTPYEIDTRGKILFIEDIDEEPYTIDRMLSQLRLAGKLNDAEGIILGDFCNCEPKEKNSLTLEKAMADVLGYLDKPIIQGLRAGHCNPMLTLEFGRKIIMDADKLVLKYI